jgi:hypothetical protein
MDTIEVTECQDSNERLESNDCPICLSSIENKCNTNGCRHEFCLNCLLEWHRQQPYCPVCRQSFSIIRHSFRSADDFDIISSELLELKTKFVNGIQEEEQQIERLQQRLSEAIERRVRNEEALERLSDIHVNSEQRLAEAIEAIVVDYRELDPYTLVYNLSPRNYSTTSINSSPDSIALAYPSEDNSLPNASPSTSYTVDRSWDSSFDSVTTRVNDPDFPSNQFHALMQMNAQLRVESSDEDIGDSNRSRELNINQD